MPSYIYRLHNFKILLYKLLIFHCVMNVKYLQQIITCCTLAHLIQKVQTEVTRRCCINILDLDVLMQ